MKTLFLALAIVFLAGTALADDTWTIEPRYHDFTPNDGFMDQGSRQNPYELRDQRGQTRGTIQPRYHDFTPGDGFMERGSYKNPYELEWDR